MALGRLTSICGGSKLKYRSQGPGGAKYGRGNTGHSRSFLLMSISLLSDLLCQDQIVLKGPHNSSSKPGHFLYYLPNIPMAKLRCHRVTQPVGGGAKISGVLCGLRPRASWQIGRAWALAWESGRAGVVSAVLLTPRGT